MKLELIREEFTENSTIGRLFIDGKFECYTLEDFDRFLENPNHKKVKSLSAIPAGTFKIDITMSPRFKKDLPLLIDVPQFEGVRIHAGNKAEDTDGCILVGKSQGKDFIGSSRDAMDALMKKLQAAKKEEEEISITIKRKGWDA
jgi:hypothetical protein